jgi:hypothetical protein
MIPELSTVDYAGVIGAVYATYRAVRFISMKFSAKYEDTEDGFKFDGKFNYTKKTDDKQDGEQQP